MTSIPSSPYVISTEDLAYAAARRRGPRPPTDPRVEPLFAAIGQLAVRGAECRSLEQAAQVIVGGLVELSGGGRAALGITRPGSSGARLCALSSVPSIDRRSERCQALQAALDEVLLSEAPTACTFGGGNKAHQTASPSRLPLKAHEHLARITGSCAVLGVRLQSRRSTVASLLWYDEGRPVDAAVAQRVLTDSSDYLGPILQTIVRAERSAVGRVRDRFCELIAGQRRRYALGATLVVCAVLLVPLPYRFTCTARLEPTARRYVVAPFDAVLENTLVEPGDVVKESQVVANLDGREVRWNLESITAKMAQTRQQYYTALVDKKHAEAELARLEAERLRLELLQLQRNQERLQIKSPIRGVVLSGELERAEGAALTTGQTLLEVAPLGELVVEIEVPDEQLRFVETGSEVALKLDAFPGRTWDGEVQRVRPMGEIRDQENVFIAEIRLANDDGTLRPGMKGRAKVSGPIRPLAWILFHRPYEAMQRWFGW